MFCPKCNAEIPENSDCCPECATPVQQKNEQPAPTKNKKKTVVTVVICIAVFLVVAIASVVIYFVTDNNDHSNVDISLSEDVNAAPNPAYEKIFKDNKITEAKPNFDSKYISEFVSITDKGNIEKIAFGYNGNRVEYMSNYIYIDIEGFGAEEIKAVDEFCKKEYAKFEKEEFGKVTYDESPSGSFYEVRIEFSDLNKASNVRQLQEWGFVQSGLAWFISIDATEDGLLKRGYIKK